MKHICIIGGGASGLAAAIVAARNHPAAQITVIEKKEKPGKKILATGNGRCNLTNSNMDLTAYRSDSMEEIQAVLEVFGYEETLDFFTSLGLLMKNRDEYIYPRNDQAASVLNVLLKEANRLQVRFLLEESVLSVQKKGKHFEITTDKQKLFSEAVILAAGGKASSKLGSDGSGYEIAKMLGHSIVPVCPALVQLRVRQNPLTPASGVRTNALVSAYVDGDYIASDSGELQLTNYGISGIPVFQISRYISKGLLSGRRCMVRLDFLPEVKQKNCKKLFLKLIGTRENITLEDLLSGVFPLKLVPVFLKASRLSGRVPVHKLKDSEWESLILSIKRMELSILDTMGFDNAQVCAGGVSLKEIDPKTMMSRKCENLFLTGELLDVDGICGGYNLQWAWATGFIAGSHIKE